MLYHARSDSIGPAHMKSFLRGYTLMEMMAVLAIITILALMAVPSYLDRIVRSQIEAAMPLADIAKKPVAAAWSLQQPFPTDNAAAGLPPADKIVNNFVSSIAIDGGAIHITFGNRANKAIAGKILSLRPAVVPDAPVVPVAWVCAKAKAPGNMTVTGSDKTNIADDLLPGGCR
jgi:type IV pilus assembly protein PilA